MKGDFFLYTENGFYANEFRFSKAYTTYLPSLRYFANGVMSQVCNTIAQILLYAAYARDNVRADQIFVVQYSDIRVYKIISSWAYKQQIYSYYYRVNRT